MLELPIRLLFFFILQRRGKLSGAGYRTHVFNFKQVMKEGEGVALTSVPVKVSVVMKPRPKQPGEERVHLAYGSGRNQEAGVDAEVVEGCCLLVCSS